MTCGRTDISLFIDLTLHLFRLYRKVFVSRLLCTLNN